MMNRRQVPTPGEKTIVGGAQAWLGNEWTLMSRGSEQSTRDGAQMDETRASCRVDRCIRGEKEDERAGQVWMCTESPTERPYLVNFSVDRR